jgi:hypothetical protein
MKEEQTAVEWLRKELETIPNYSAFYTNNYQWIDLIMNQALKYEDEQTDKARTNGFNFAKNINQ